MPCPPASRQRAEQRDQERLAAAGLKGERTVEEWLAHPTALDRLLKAMGQRGSISPARNRRAIAS